MIVNISADGGRTPVGALFLGEFARLILVTDRGKQRRVCGIYQKPVGHTQKNEKNL